MTTPLSLASAKRLVTAQKPRSRGRSQGNFGLVVKLLHVMACKNLTTKRWRRLRGTPSRGWPGRIPRYPRRCGPCRPGGARGVAERAGRHHVRGRRGHRAVLRQVGARRERDRPRRGGGPAGLGGV